MIRWMLLWVWAGAAAAHCEFTTPLTALPESASARSVVRQRLQMAQPACLNTAHFWANYGAVLLAENDIAAAALALERALLLDPTLLGAKVDYALVLARSGEWQGAVQLAQAVLQQPDIPGRVATQLHQWQQQWLQQQNPQHGRVGWYVGHDTNLTSAPKTDSLTLTFPSGDATLAIADAFRPQGGTVQLIEANLARVHTLNNGQQLHLYGDFRGRQTGVNAANYQQFEVGMLHLGVNGLGRYWWDAHWQELIGKGQHWYRGMRVGWTQELEPSPGWSYFPTQWLNDFDACRPRTGVEVEQRNYVQTPALNSVFIAANVALYCQLDIQHSWQLAVRVGQELARDSQRPGGDQQRLDTRFFWRQPWLNGQLYTDLSYSWQKDQNGYSPLLRQNARRRQNRWGLKLEYSQPLAMLPRWEGVASLEMSRQHANLALFATESQAVYLGVRYHW